MFRLQHLSLAVIPCVNGFDCLFRVGSMSLALVSHPMNRREKFHSVRRFESVYPVRDYFKTLTRLGSVMQHRIGRFNGTGQQFDIVILLRAITISSGEVSIDHL